LVDTAFGTVDFLHSIRQLKYPFSVTL
jgi:hypothetical protein